MKSETRNGVAAPNTWHMVGKRNYVEVLARCDTFVIVWAVELAEMALEDYRNDLKSPRKNVALRNCSLGVESNPRGKVPTFAEANGLTAAAPLPLRGPSLSLDCVRLRGLSFTPLGLDALDSLLRSVEPHRRLDRLSSRTIAAPRPFGRCAS